MSTVSSDIVLRVLLSDQQGLLHAGHSLYEPCLIPRRLSRAVHRDQSARRGAGSTLRLNARPANLATKVVKSDPDLRSGAHSSYLEGTDVLKWLHFSNSTTPAPRTPSRACAVETVRRNCGRPWSAVGTSLHRPAACSGNCMPGASFRSCGVWWQRGHRYPPNTGGSV
jgi:hypothetical protein